MFFLFITYQLLLQIFMNCFTMNQLKKLLVIFLTILMGISAQSQVSVSSLNIPEGLKITESFVLANGTAIFLLTIDANQNFAFYSANLTKEKTFGAATPVAGLNQHILQGAQIKGFSLSIDSRLLFISANFAAGKGGFDIYRLVRNGNDWSKPENIGSPINTALDEMEPSISADENSLYFTRPITEVNSFSSDFECNKIFVAEKNINGEWEEPYDLTKPINLFCESRPRIAPDNKTLYYSSVRENADLGFDVYYTQQIAKKIWKLPIKIDTLSTANNDWALSFPAFQEYFIVSSVAKKSKSKEPSFLNNAPVPAQFFQDKLVSISGNITDLYSNKPIEAKIEVANPESKRILASYLSSEINGEFFFTLTTGQKYDLSLYKENYSYRFESLDLSSENKFGLRKKDFTLFSSISLFLNVFDAEDFSPLDARISVIEQSSGNPIDAKINAERKGRYIIGLEIGKKYNIKVEADNHNPFEIPFSLDEIVQFSNFERDVDLQPNYETLEVEVTNMETQEVLDSVQIYVVDVETGEELKVYAAKNEEGKYDLKLKKGKKYNVKVKAPKGYAFYNTEVDLNNEAPQKMEVKLEPLNAQTKLTFSAVQFETNSAELDISSFTQLDQLVELLLDNENVKVEISAHTDDVGSDIYNQRLSEKRAQSVVNYLIEKKVPSSRLIPRGYGESKPIVPNDNDENRAKNRRVELRILDVNIQN